jgi:hypothetical protein
MHGTLLHAPGPACERMDVRTPLQTLARYVEENWFFLLLVMGVAAAWLFLRQQGSALSSLEDFDRKIQSGQPVVVELFSNT